MAKSNGKEYRELLVERVKALSHDVIELAPDLVGNADLISNFEIHLKFPPDALPTIELVREHIGEQAMKVIGEEYLRRDK